MDSDFLDERKEIGRKVIEKRGERVREDEDNRWEGYVRVPLIEQNISEWELFYGEKHKFQVCLHTHVCIFSCMYLKSSSNLEFA